ncbi:MAG: ISAzo13 family transposase [Myxococcales bacterium]|nr:ISAzo13 family transposase [Myxococcales bacterium]
MTCLHVRVVLCRWCGAMGLQLRGYASMGLQMRGYAAAVAEQHAAGNPAISVDTKKKELVGNSKNGGREWQPEGEPVKVDSHDFMGDLGRASPYGVYDIGDNSGWVSVGISADTAEFAVATVGRWWHAMAVERYRAASQLLITADWGGSNGNRLRLWKLELQKFSDQLHIPIKVCHLPPGTSKWNKIEHRMFSHISLNWRGKPLESYRTIVELIGATKTQHGLTVRCELDSNTYARDRVIPDADMNGINIVRDEFHGEWNYTIRPH